MRLSIVEYPDKKLRERSVLVDKFDRDLHQLLDSMYPIMMNTNGIGLAAIQVAHAKQVLILNLPDENDEQSVENLIEMINPVITTTNGETTYQEDRKSVV